MKIAVLGSKGTFSDKENRQKIQPMKISWAEGSYLREHCDTKVAQ